MDRRKLYLYEGKRAIGGVVGAFLYAAGINLFVVPAGLYSGGIMGVCQVIRTLLMEFLHMDFGTVDIAGIIYYILNIPIFVVAYRKLGKKFFVKTVITVTASTMILSLSWIFWFLRRIRYRP